MRKCFGNFIFYHIKACYLLNSFSIANYDQQIPSSFVVEICTCSLYSIVCIHFGHFWSAKLYLGEIQLHASWQRIMRLLVWNLHQQTLKNKLFVCFIEPLLLLFKVSFTLLKFSNLSSSRLGDVISVLSHLGLDLLHSTRSASDKISLRM